MSEYQYYEFRAIDRPLDDAAQQALRSISSRARITATSFTNHYEWGDLKGDPRNFMERWFDLHLYLANWGTRRLMMRLPARCLDRADIDPFLRDADRVDVLTAGGNVIVDIHRDEMEPDDDGDDGRGWLAALAPLRADVFSGDLRLFYLVWLTAVQDALIADSEVEPLPGIGPLTAALDAFVAFFDIDRDLVAAAAESGAGAGALALASTRQAPAASAEHEKTEVLPRVAQGADHVAAAPNSTIGSRHRVSRSASRRAVGELRRRAQEIGEARQSAKAERRAAERRQQAVKAEQARRQRLNALRQRGEGVWREIEAEIRRSHAAGYDRAAALLSDFQALAVEERSQADFRGRLAAIRVRHGKKGKLIERLERLGDGGEEGAA